MQEEAFRAWLEGQYQSNTISSRISNCRNIEKSEGDLDDHFLKDQGIDLLQRLNYTKNDEQNNLPAKHHIHIDGDVYNGTSTLKQAASLYFNFKNENIVHVDHPQKMI